MNNKLYKIKPLVWVESLDADDMQQFTAMVGFSNLYTVSKCTDNISNGWKWQYCFAEYYDEDYGYLDTKEACIEFCEKNFMNRLLEVLEEVKS